MSPHYYANFTDAFGDLCSANTLYRSYIEDCYDKCDTADDKANAGDFKWGIRYAVYAIKALATAVDKVVDGQYNDPNTSHFYESIYWAAQQGGDGVDMDAILSAMVGAEAEQVTFFIGLVDAYRSALWLKPFNAEFYAALARGFMQKWP